MRHNPLSIRYFWAAAACVFAAESPVAATDQYFAGDGSALSSSKWSATAGGPYTQGLTSGNIANFAVVNGTGTGGSIVIGGINATESFTLSSPTGTISNSGNGVVGITVASGKTLDFGSQAFTNSGIAGYIKNGGGVLALVGGNYGGGFTLNAGTVILRNNNALGNNTVNSSNTLTINGGTIASNSGRDLSGKYGGGITVGGDFQLGDTTGLAGSSAGLMFSNAMNLGSANRTITLGNNGTMTRMPLS